MGRFIDRSNVNGADDYRKAPVSYLYLKATEGLHFVDGTRTERRAIAHASSVAVVGDYHFADLADPVAECEHFLSVIGRPRPGQFRPCLDLERGTAVTDVRWAEAWIAHFKVKMGYLPVLYGSTSLVAPLRAASKLIRSCPWWRAEYGPNDGRWHAPSGGRQGAVAHQFTSVARLPGISGNCDRSRFLAPCGSMLVPHPHKAHRAASKAWDWAAWYMGVGRYQGHARVKRLRPHVPRKVPKAWWRMVAWYVKHGFKVNGR